jgi:thymidylate kinase
MTFQIIEGPNGSGKTSLINKFKEKTNFSVLQNPGTTELGKLLRPICRGENQWSTLHDSVRSLLFSAIRNDLYDNIKNKPVNYIVDRWWMSTFIYQILIAGLPIANLEATIYPGEKIDKVILLDADDDILIKRVNSERESNKSHSHDLWTNEEMIKKVAAGYRTPLRYYLEYKKIPYQIINTTYMDSEQVYSIAKNILNKDCDVK